MADTPTTKTLNDIIQIGASFRHEYSVGRDLYRMTLERFHRYIWIETVVPSVEPEGGWTAENPDPGPTSTWGWHPNVNILYNAQERVVLKAYYDKIVEICSFFDTFMIENEASVALMFNPTPKIDLLLGTVLSGVIEG